MVSKKLCQGCYSITFFSAHSPKASFIITNALWREACLITGGPRTMFFKGQDPSFQAMVH